MTCYYINNKPVSTINMAKPLNAGFRILGAQMKGGVLRNKRLNINFDQRNFYQLRC